MRGDDSVINNENNDSESNSCEQHSINEFSNKEISANHTHWTSGDDTDSDWASSSPVKHHNNRTAPKTLPAVTMRKHTGIKRSLFSLDDSSQEQPAGIVKKSLGKLKLYTHTQTHSIYMVI